MMAPSLFQTSALCPGSTSVPILIGGGHIDTSLGWDLLYQSLTGWGELHPLGTCSLNARCAKSPSFCVMGQMDTKGPQVRT